MTSRASHASRSVRQLDQERGSVLVFLLVLIIPLIGLSAAMISSGSRQVTEREASRGRKLAMLNAESGIDHALAQLLSSPTQFDSIEVAYGNGESLKYYVELEDLGSDDLDNDSDGLVDEDDEAPLRRLVSRGAINVADFAADGSPIPTAPKHYTKEIRAFGKTFTGLPMFPWAVYLGDPNAEIQFNGNSFIIDGHDHDLDGNTLTDSPELGIATTGFAEDIVDQLGFNQSDNVIGDGGDPSVGNVDTVDIQKYIDDYKSGANITFSGGSTYNGSLGSLESGYVTTHSDGDLQLSNGSTGAGLLLVEGNLEISGSFDYTGVIIVTGQVVFRGGGDHKRVVGTLLVGGDVIDESLSGGISSNEDLELSGTVDILYSSEAQQNVGEAVSTMTIFGWQEL